MNRIRSIRFELSGECPLKSEHTFCPASKLPNAVLPNKIIFKVIKSLPEDYNGDIGFHNYNEPLADKRLTSLIFGIKRHHLPHAKITIWTNGIYLTSKVADTLMHMGVDEIILTKYKDTNVYSKLIQAYPPDIDDRITNYEKPVINSTIPCDAPFGQLIINRFGQVALCCMDWNYTMTFGDLNKQSLEECFSAMEVVYQNLIKGKRIYDVCSRCNRTRIKLNNNKVAR
jgi:MoaA/NifB/PqqE/SkfB family radical SAM enzyme